MTYPYHETLVVNFFGGPGAGKTTLAAEVFAELKKLHIRVRLVQEYATFLIDTQREHVLKEDQVYIFGKQHHLLATLVGKARVVVTDSPLPLCALYAPPSYPICFQDTVFHFFEQFNNLNFFVESPRTTYDSWGRHPNVATARELDEELKNLLASRGLAIATINPSNAISSAIAKEIVGHL